MRLYSSANRSLWLSDGVAAIEEVLGTINNKLCASLSCHVHRGDKPATCVMLKNLSHTAFSFCPREFLWCRFSNMLFTRLLHNIRPHSHNGLLTTSTVLDY